MFAENQDREEHSDRMLQWYCTQFIGLTVKMLTLLLNENFQNINGASIKTDCILPTQINGPLSKLATVRHQVISP